MGWNDVKIIGDEETVEVSYEGFCEEIKKNAKMLGMNEAIELFVKEQFNVKGNIQGIREQKNRNLFLVECDEVYNILLTALKAVIDCVIPSITDKRVYYSCLYNRGAKNMQDIIDFNKSDISAIKNRNPRIEGVDSLKRLRCGKSVMEVFLEEIDTVIELYCNMTKKDLPKMRSRICYTAWQGFDVVLDADNVEKNESFLSWLSLGLNFMNKSKVERIQHPFSYYLDALD